MSEEQLENQCGCSRASQGVVGDEVPKVGNGGLITKESLLRFLLPTSWSLVGKSSDSVPAL